MWTFSGGRRSEYAKRIDGAKRSQIGSRKSALPVGEAGVPEGRERVAGGGASGTPGFLQQFSVRPGGAREWRREVVPTGRPNDRFPGIACFSRPAGAVFWMLILRWLRSFLAPPPAHFSGSFRALTRASGIHVLRSSGSWSGELALSRGRDRLTFKFRGNEESRFVAQAPQGVRDAVDLSRFLGPKHNTDHADYR